MKLSLLVKSLLMLLAALPLDNSTLVLTYASAIASCIHVCMVAISYYVKYLKCNHKHIGYTTETEQCTLCSIIMKPTPLSC